MSAIIEPPASTRLTNSSLSPKEAATEAVQRLRARNQLTEFVSYTKPDYEFANHHRQIIEALEAVERGEIKRLIIEAPPRHGKSELVSRRFPAWFIGRNPDKEIICATYGQDFADDFGREVRNIVGSQDFANVFPDVSLRPDSQAANRWHTNHGGIYVSVGVEGPATGRGFHVGLIDDPFKDRADADSELKQEKVWRWYTSVFLLRQMKDAAIIVTATRWNELDLTGRILEAAKKSGEKWHVLKLPAVNEYGQALWQERYSIDHLNLIRDTLSPREWLSLFQQEPTAEEGTQFKREWFKRRYSSLPRELNFYLSGDFAVTPDDGDFTELAVWSVDPIGMLRPVAWWSAQAENVEWAPVLVAMAKQWGAYTFIGESGVIRRASEPLIREAMRQANHYLTLEWLPSSLGNKPAMAKPFEALCSNGRVEFPEAIWAEEVISQLLKFPGGRHDDKVDTCSLFGRYINKTWNPPVSAPPKPSFEKAWEDRPTMHDLMSEVLKRNRRE